MNEVVRVEGLTKVFVSDWRRRRIPADDERVGVDLLEYPVQGLEATRLHVRLQVSVGGGESLRGELYLGHQWEGVDVRFDQAIDTLRNVHHIWRRPVHLETKEEGRGRLISFDGENHSIKDVTPSE